MKLYEPEEEEIFQVDVYPDAIVFSRENTQPLQPEQSGGISMVLAICLIVALFPVASIVGQVYLATHPFTATVQVQANTLSTLAHVYSLPVVTETQSQVVVSTG